MSFSPHTVAVSLFLLLGAVLVASAPDTYGIPLATGECTAKLVLDGSQRVASTFPLNDTTEEVRPVTIRFALTNTGWKPVQTPYSVSLVNPGYLDAYHYDPFSLATEVDAG